MSEKVANAQRKTLTNLQKDLLKMTLKRSGSLKAKYNIMKMKIS